MGWRRWFQKDVLPFTAMVTVECTNVGLNVLFKAATLKGLSYYVFIVYSNLVATLVLLPLLFLFPNPRTGLPSFNLSLLLKVFLLGLIGFLADLCGYIGINYSSPTLDSAMSNLTPAFTFILAVFFRMESLALRSYSTQAKIMGTLVSISGALVVVLYKGPTILSTPSDPNPSPMLGTPPTNWVIGGLLCALQFLLNSTWYILQTHVMKAYPAEIVLVFLYNLCGTIISAPVCFIAETNLSAWRLRPDIALVAIIYSGCLGSSFGSLVHTWALHLKGPVYISIFKPLSIAIAAALSVIFLGDALSLGSVVGAIILSLGFYAVIWGKSKEEQMKPLPIGMGKAPLLESYKVENINTERERERERGASMAAVGRSFYRDVLPFTAMVTMECVNVGLNTLFKAATLNGMSYHVFVVYSYSIAAFVLIPAPFISHRSRVLPPLNFSIMSKVLLLGLIGSSSQIMGYTGINYSSPTLASAISNLVPAFTFILAIIFRLESAALRKRSSQAKILGTVVSLAGAFVVTLYKGPPIVFANQSQSLSLHQPLLNSTPTNPNWIVGGLLLTAEYILVPLWYIVQAQIMKEYPNELTVIFFYNVCVVAVSAAVALITEPNSSAWKLRPDIALLSVLCSGLFGSFLNNAVHTWVLRLKGPVFVTMFKPLSMAIAVAMGVAFLRDTLHLGSLVGATIISIGFYTVLWGKTKEEAGEESVPASLESPSTTHKAPLLQNYKNENSDEE
ncbi:hypothetical protein DVH24_031804 [Malus domestica]|uniref:EamA domain-containing protein n=1 Tax=Malus domestica TaxID=3750 RepID=A0A498J498_MALDO|nr:hypothetical protein DVH24_031804 [Malus domestica]